MRSFEPGKRLAFANVGLRACELLGGLSVKGFVFEWLNDPMAR
jgi:hypothetical protein